jgi:hypothetical protein
MIIDWLLEDNSWLNYAIETQLLEKMVEPSLVTTDSRIQIVVNRLKDSTVGISSLKSGKVAYANASKCN